MRTPRGFVRGCVDACLYAALASGIGVCVTVSVL
jgi:hypothetical protein